MRSRNRARTRVDSEHLLLLKGLLLWIVVGTTFLGAWHYGLLDRVWFEARVPYIPYRGVDGSTGPGTWIPLDPAFKLRHYQPGVAGIPDQVVFDDGAQPLQAEFMFSGIGGIDDAIGVYEQDLHRSLGRRRLRWGS